MDDHLNCPRALGSFSFGIEIVCLNCQPLVDVSVI